MAPQTTPETQAGATLSLDGKSLTLPVVRGSEGETAVDVQQLRAKTGMITLDPGFANTGSCRSAITFIDGEKGILRYRGYPIDDLAQHSSFLEVAWLLLHGALPTRAELGTFTHDVTHHTLLHEDFDRFFDAMPKDAHPMPVAAAAVGALATYYQDPETEDNLRDAIVRLIAKMPTIAAYSYKHSIGQPSMYPQNRLDYASNFLRMMFATPCEEYEVDPTLARAIDLLLILHADHEQNCSTSTVRMVGSSRANLFASVSAGISALWGPLHGGANQKVIEMLERIAAEEGSAEVFLNRAKDKNDTTRLMGFGHRVYKSYDPRAAILKKACGEVIGRMKSASRMLDIAMRLEEIALKDDYFVSHKLYPNVDFYSGVIYKAMGIPMNMFTVMFAMGRMPGWIAQWLEMRNDPDTKIARPRQIYTGATQRAYVPMAKRG
ncbi:MAG: citrate (Si)-synthase [Candidatus Eisenbacteria bacterium RBG_16_71_46]|nr:MAG: citrate (Si)-synthase [Candidatus Eisenbacteria bacterium RBG_16_71_46]OGF23512.1 MAG: citrate (Si)-synthase [Candidatus Eisenbacteria bacterium RBG_19FT_COMBO_70_11]